MLRPAEAAATGQTPLPLRRPASEKSLCRNTVHVLQGDKVRVLASQEPVAWCRPVWVHLGCARLCEECARASLSPSAPTL